MSTEGLHRAWNDETKSRLSTTSHSFRLPIIIGAQLEALCEIYPKKNKTEIVTDLLASALEDLRKTLPTEPLPLTQYYSQLEGGIGELFELRSQELVREMYRREQSNAPIVKLIPPKRDPSE